MARAVAWLICMDDEGLMHRRVVGGGALMCPAGCVPQGSLRTVDLDPAEAPRSSLCMACWPPARALSHEEVWGVAR